MYNRIKRILDIIFSFLALIVLLPVLLLIALAIKLESKGPVFFKQKRVGIFKTHFYIIKFRTMRSDAPGDIPTHMLVDSHKYITVAGKILRKTSIDELPQLFNVLAGHMSIVGPRPALWNQIDLIAEREKYGANNIKPGLTGWAQINGRDELPIAVKATFDGEYVKKMGFLMDTKCFLLTILKIFTAEGVKEEQGNKTVRK